MLFFFYLQVTAYPVSDMTDREGDRLELGSARIKELQVMIDSGQCSPFLAFFSVVLILSRAGL